MLPDKYQHRLHTNVQLFSELFAGMADLEQSAVDKFQGLLLDRVQIFIDFLFENGTMELLESKMNNCEFYALDYAIRHDTFHPELTKNHYLKIFESIHSILASVKYGACFEFAIKISAAFKGWFSDFEIKEFLYLAMLSTLEDENDKTMISLKNAIEKIREIRGAS